MTKGNFVKGMVAGTILGVGASMIINPIDSRDRNRMAKSTSKMFTTIGAFADHLMDMSK